MATPSGSSNCAPVPVPLPDPATPACPAQVLTTRPVVILRIRSLP